MSLETGEKRQLTNPQPPASADTNPAVSPDGSWLVYRRQAGGLFAGELYRLALGKGLTASGEPQQLTPAVMDALYPAWRPGSNEILFSAKGGLWRLDVSSDSQPARLPFVGQDGLMAVMSRPQPGQQSRLVYVRSFEDANIWNVRLPDPGAAADSPPEVFISSTRGDWFPEFSPNGRRIAFASDRLGGGGIWVADVDGSNVLQLASMGAFATGAPRWSPDGERIVFHSNPLGQGDVFVISAAGGSPRNLTSHPANDSFPSFSRDAKWIYFSSDRDGGQRQIWKMPAAGGNPVQVPHTIGYAPMESPDGLYLYYVQTLEKPSPLWRIPVSGGAAVKVLEGVVLSNFVVRERGIYYIDRPSDQGGVNYMDKPSGEGRLQYFDFTTRRTTTATRNLGDVGNFLTVSPDGRTILYNRIDSSIDDLMLVENFR
jgi:Tol biopolymer transport system component